MRILLFTGKGGVGKTTLAAATAVRAARSGLCTLVLSTDTAHSLSDALGAPGTPEPSELEPGLWIQQVDPQRRFEESWVSIQGYLMSVLDSTGVDPITAEELTVVPGAEEVLALLEVRRQARSGRWDVLVVDCAPTAETLRLLALPEALQWYMAKVFPIERHVVRALSPVLTKATGVPMPGESVFDALDQLHREMGEVRDLLSGPQASVRLVLTPERVVLAEARRTFTTLSLYGYRVDGIVANRVFPQGTEDAWVAGWADAQNGVLSEVAESFAGVRQWQAHYLSGEPVGPEALADLATAVYADDDALQLPPVEPILRFDSRAGGTLVRLTLPLATGSEVDLVRHGEELVITLGAYRRLITLPPAVARQRVAGARVFDGEVQVRFEPVAEVP